MMENARLRAQRLDIEELLDAISAQEDAVTRSTRALGERFATARRMVDFASESDALGAILLAYWEDIDSYRLADPTTQLSRHLGDTVISHIHHEEALAEIVNVSGYITGRIRDAGLVGATIAEASRDVLVELVRFRREHLRRIIEVESDYIFALSELEADHSQLTTITEEYEKYLGVLILWTPSRQRLWKLNPRALPDEIRDVMGKLRESRTTIEPTFVVLLLFASILFIARRRMWDVQLVQNSRILRPRSDSIRFTFLALFLTGLRVLPATLLIVAIGALFSRDSTLTMASLTTAINFLAVVLFTLIFTRTLCDENGVARAHFGWSSNLCDQWLEDASWLIRWWLPIAALAAIVFMLANATAAAGRLTLLLAIGVLIGRLVSNIRRGMRVSEWRWSIVTANRLRLVFVAVLILLAAGVFWGLRYSVGIITNSLLTTVCIGLGLLLVHSLLMRWLRVVNRRLRFAELQNLKTKKATSEIDTIEEDQIGLLEISEATTRLLHVVTMVATVVAMLYIWAPLLPALNLLSEVTLWTSSSVVEGEAVITQITLETLVVVIFLVSVTLAAARNLPALVELVMRSRTALTAGAR
jgi:potassium efflux system protein